MYRIEKIRFEDRHRHYWTSDWHAFHDPKWELPIWEARGYSSAKDAAEKTLETVNQRVGENDVLWYLGDGFLNASDEEVVSWLSALKCKNVKYLFGNHESNMFRLYRQEVKRQYGLDNVEVYPLRMGNIEFIGNHAEILIGKKQIVMNHFPLRIWKSDNRGSWCLSGHSHLNDVGRRPDAELQKAMDVGWDYKKDVWSYNEIEDVMSTKTIHIYDHNRDH